MSKLDVSINAVMKKISVLSTRKEFIAAEIAEKEKIVRKPTNIPNLLDKVRHIDWKLEYLAEYLEDLKAIKTFEEDGIKIRYLTSEIYQKYISNADISEVEIDGKYCKLSRVTKFPLCDIYICWITPVKYF